MQKTIDIIKLPSTLLNSKLVVILVVISSFISCNDLSDQMVYETDSKKHFNVEGIVENLRLNKSKFKEEVITVEGFIKDINYLNKRQTVLLHGSENSNMSVICDMQNSERDLLESLEIGEYVTIKGILKGSLNDVILLSCIISNRQINE